MLSGPAAMRPTPQPTTSPPRRLVFDETHASRRDAPGMDPVRAGGTADVHTKERSMMEVLKHGDPMTARQERLHAFMIEHQRASGFPPSVRDIMKAFGMASPNGVRNHLQSLVRKGWARGVETESIDGRVRNRYVAVDPSNPDACPCCGKPIEEGGAA